MDPTPDSDTRSPWYEAFAPNENVPDMVWLPGTQFPAPPGEAEAAGAMGGGSEDQWATDALFDCYNG